jgi:hypothetical protein
MCTVDIGVLGQVWWKGPEGQPEAFVDFNTQHVCRNFDAVRQWAEERQMPEVTPDDWIPLPPAGTKILDSIP